MFSLILTSMEKENAECSESEGPSFENESKVLGNGMNVHAELVCEESLPCMYLSIRTRTRRRGKNKKVK